MTRSEYMVCDATKPANSAIVAIIPLETRLILIALGALSKIDGVDQMPLWQIEDEMDRRENHDP